MVIIERLLKGRKKLICLGDSHVEIFNYIKIQNLLKEFDIEVLSVSGATAMGIVNPNSQTNAFKIFWEFLSGKDKNSYIVLQLGEVDCGFVIWYRAKKYQLTVQEQFEYSLKNYFIFIKKIHKKFKNIILTGSVIPTIKENQDFGEVANLRKKVKVSLLERTKLTQNYNLELKKFAKKLNIFYFDIIDDVINKSSGVVNEKFLNENKFDHHLSFSKTAGFWVKKIKDLNLK